MNKVLILLTLASGWMLRDLPAGSGPAAPGRTSSGLTALELLARSDEYRNAWPNSRALTHITHYVEDEAAHEADFECFSRGADKVLVKSLDPRSRGLRVLVSGDDMWLALPDVAKPFRIVPAQRLIGQVSNGDVARTRFAADYEAALLREEVWHGEQCAVLALTAKRKGATYRHIDFWIRLSDCTPRRADFFLTSGKLSKTAEFESYQVFSGHRQLNRMTIYDRIKMQEKTTIEIRSVIPYALAEKYFNVNRLSDL